MDAGTDPSQLPDYLWGIETWDEWVEIDEEKLLLPDYLWGIETTLSNIWMWEGYDRFQTTYEELKPTLHSLRSVRGALPDYLWGIETKSRNRRGFGHLVLPDYLWGIETQHPQPWA